MNWSSKKLTMPLICILLGSLIFSALVNTSGRSLAVVSYDVQDDVLRSVVKYEKLSESNNNILYVCQDNNGKVFELIVTAPENVKPFAFAVLNNEIDSANEYDEIGLWDGTKLVWQSK